MAILFGNGQDGTVTISSDTNLGTAIFKQYTSLTINSGKTLSGNAGLSIYVQQTLTLTGNISVSQHGTAGGALFIYARNCSGTGTISANASGQGGSAAPIIEGLTSPSAPTGGGNGSSGVGGAAGAAGGTFSIDQLSSKIRSLLGTGQTSRYRIYGGQGSSTVGNASNGNSGGGAGGGSLIDSGGAGGAGASGGSSAAGGSGGQGGSSGGLVVIVSYSIVSFTIQAQGSNGAAGGNGTAGGGTAGAGGGGGGGGSGGLIFVIAVRYTGSVTVTNGTGGAGGTGSASPVGNNGANGSDGELGRLVFWDIRSVL